MIKNDPKAMIRIHPEIKKMLSIAASLEDKHNYEMANDLLLEGLFQNHPELYVKCMEALGEQYAVKRKLIKRSNTDRRQNERNISD